jgi:hypothetical protein
MDVISIVFTVVFTLISLYFGGSLFMKLRASSGSILQTLSAVFLSITNFIPLGLITFGFLADLMGQEFRYSIGSMIGFSAITLSWLGTRFLTPDGTVTSAQAESPGVGWCMIPGLEVFESKYLPMNIVSSSAILMYYLIYAATTRDTSQNISIFIAFPLLFCLQLLTFYLGGCEAFYFGGIRMKFLGLLLGSAVGAIGYAIVSTQFPNAGPFNYIKGRGAASGAGGSGNSGLRSEGFLSGDGWNPKSTSAPGSADSQTEMKQCPAEEQDTIPVIAIPYKNGSPVEDISK